MSESLVGKIVELQLKINLVANGSPVSFYKLKGEIFHAAYLANGKNQRRAAHALGVPKSTFHDWLKNYTVPEVSK